MGVDCSERERETMDTNLFLLLLAVLSAVLSLMEVLRNSLGNSHGWIAVSSGLLLVSLLLFLWVPRRAGYPSIGLWIVFGVIPMRAFRVLAEGAAR